MQTHTCAGRRPRGRSSTAVRLLLPLTAALGPGDQVRPRWAPRTRELALPMSTGPEALALPWSRLRPRDPKPLPPIPGMSCLLTPFSCLPVSGVGDPLSVTCPLGWLRRPLGPPRPPSDLACVHWPSSDPRVGISECPALACAATTDPLPWARPQPQLPPLLLASASVTSVAGAAAGASQPEVSSVPGFRSGHTPAPVSGFRSGHAPAPVSGRRTGRP